MKENDIRPEELLNVALDLHKQDIEDIMKKKHEFIEFCCPSCGKNKNNLVYKKEGFLFNKCTKCNTVYISPRPTAKLLEEFYDNSKSMVYWNQVLFPSSEVYRKENIFKNRALKVIEICQKYGNDFGTIVDVGAGYGTFCEVLKELNGFERVVAVESSIGLAETCKHKGIETINKQIEEVVLKDVSVVTNFEVLEHLFNPEEFVKACYRVLPKDGMFVLTTPNIDGFELSMLETFSPNIGGPEHLNYFNPSSITYLLEKSGFEVLEISTPGKLDAELVRKEIINGNIDVSEDRFLQMVLVDQWEKVGESFQNFLEINKLSSHMWVVAKK
ncbi:methyltransferase domain-containing protein [Acetobacterium malicum]|uniref:Methyltransferase domain-containing protein n=1 Tax=Acetobacterium malicum TaxID=52692 RepID=A0ABR6YV53_9FIRM|nr:methyltransferase domain-containing protein [Acetobacterium malicum]MBC3899064.1 methyltransferase domain-containing protein [Acetobacterium malicum]